MAERAVRPTTARQGELMMIGKAATTSHRTVVRESWAEPPFPPSPEPPLPPPPEPPVPHPCSRHRRPHPRERDALGREPGRKGRLSTPMIP